MGNKITSVRIKARGNFIGISLFLVLFPFINSQTNMLKAQEQLCVAVGGTGDDQGHSLVQTSDGGYVIAGQTTSFGAGGLDVYIVKISSTGALQWTRTVGGTADDYGRSIIQTSDGGYAIAAATLSYGAGGSDFYIIRLDAAGAVQWTKTVGTTSTEFAAEIVQSPDGGFAVAGQTNSIGAGANDMYLVKLDALGNLLWDKRIGNGGVAEIAYSLTNTTDGGFALCGTIFNFSGSVSTSSVDYYIVKVDGTGNLIWSRVIANPSPGNYFPDYARSIKQTSDGGYIVCGESGQPGSTGGYDAHYLVVKLNSSGAVVWNRYFGGINIPGVSIDNSDYAESIIETADGGFVIGGWSFSFNYNFQTSQNVGLEIFIVKIDANGNLRWTRVLGGTENEVGKCIVQTSDGGFAVAGYLQPRVAGQGIGNEQLYFVKLDFDLNTCCPTRTIGNDRGTGGTYSTSGASYAGTGIANSGGTYNTGGTLQIYAPCIVVLSVSTTKTDVLCKGACTGTATATASFGSTPYTYSWSPGGQTTAAITGLCAGSYTVTVTDALGDTASSTVTITEPSTVVSASLIPGDVTCFGLCDGTALFSASGGTPGYTYSYSPAASPIGFCAGNYVGTATDNSGCTDTVQFTIDEPAAIVLSKISTDANCGNSDGSATVSIQSGGTGPFSFSWNTNPVQTTASVTGLVAGSYICIVTDANNCIQTSDVTIGNIGGGVASISSTNQVSCFGGNDGSATALITGGNGPFSYAWNTTPVQTTATATGLIAGSYTCTITSTNGCIATASVTITEPDQINAVSSTLPSACGATNGSATVTINSGGVSPFSYSWNSTPIQTTATANNLAAGSYVCTITDANSCTQLANAIIDSDGGGTTSISGSTDILCFGLSTGSSTATITGGQPPYTYSWNTTPVQNTQTATGLPAGIYNCTISDANGCVKTVTDTLVQPVAITSQASSIAACGINNGSATALVQGGNLPYSYNWSPSGGNTSTATGLPNGLYICTITDANGCIDTCSVNVVSKPSPTAYAGEDVTIRIGSDTLLVGSGGGSYSWFPYESLSCDNCQSPAANPLSTTTYVLTVTASNGCSSVDSVTVFVDIQCGEVFVPNAFSPNGDTENDLECVYGNCIKTLQFSIYNRWGEKVFESNSQKLCWDGTYKGSPMNTGVFVYVLEADLVTGEQVRKKGEINLIR